MKILLTGANGYIGQRLLPVLIEEGHQVVCLVRDRRRLRVQDAANEKIEIAEADLLDKNSLDSLPKDIDTAYFLVHSMGKGKEFSEREAAIAHNFAEYIDTTRAQQIIYLSGIVNDPNELSEHLQSRLNVEEILQQSKVPVTILRAAIIIGSGSASFEIIRDLVEKLPVMVAPRWVKNRCQPIAIRDVIKYLTGVLGQAQAFNKIYDIGGPDILTYKEMMLKYAEIRGFRRIIQVVPVLTPKLSSYWLYFISSTSFPLAMELVNSLKNEVVVQKVGIDEIVPLEKTPYDEAIKLAFSRIEQNMVISSWKDALASGKMTGKYMDFIQVPEKGVFKDEKKAAIKGDITEVIERIWKIGGGTGWYYMGWAWEARGILDKMTGGVGLRRGRRSPDQIQAGDALDFWRVILADKKKGRLLLFAEMNLPGEAWLEFNFKQNGEECLLYQTATFRPKGVAGRLYWYVLYPFHVLIFRGMHRRIAQGE